MSSSSSISTSTGVSGSAGPALAASGSSSVAGGHTGSDGSRLRRFTDVSAIAALAGSTEKRSSSVMKSRRQS